MEKQKICIIGGGLAGLTTALTLSDLDVNIDLVCGKMNQNLFSNRTVAVSENNLDFFNFTKNKFWPCSKMKLFSQNEKNQFLKVFNIEKEKKKIFYMIENSKLIKYVIKSINVKKNISLKKNETISEIRSSGLLKTVNFKNYSSKYNLIILCVGKNSGLVKNTFFDNSIKSSYEEVSITAIINHNPLKNNTARQIFLNNGIFALLPLSNFKTSIVWTTNKSIRKKSDLYIKKNIKFFSKNFLKNIKLGNTFEINDLNFFIREKYYKDRILLFGDTLHVVHPFAGQGFNMILRDLRNLKENLNDRISLGLDIGATDFLSDFSDHSKPRNFVYSFSLDLLRNCFKLNSKPFKEFRNLVMMNLNKSNYAKNKIYDFAN